MYGQCHMCAQSKEPEKHWWLWKIWDPKNESHEFYLCTKHIKIPFYRDLIDVGGFEMEEVYIPGGGQNR